GLQFLAGRADPLVEGPGTVAVAGTDVAVNESGGEVQFLPYVSHDSSNGPPRGQQPTLISWPSTPTEEPARHDSSPSPAPGGPQKAQGESGAIGHGAAARKGTGTTTFFDVPAKGQRIVYVIDASMSMGKNGALVRACRE